MIIAIDGPAGAGKSTIARSVAAELGFAFLDSGALYRCAVLAGMKRGVPAELAVDEANIELGQRVVLNGEDVTAAIRDAAVTRATPAAAARPALRAALTRKQRALLSRGNWVAEGRDVGTVVMPTADLKVFLTASPEARARRRSLESGESFEKVREAIVERDRMDTQREHGRLKAAADAVTLDTTSMSLREVVDAVLALVPNRHERAPALFGGTPAELSAPANAAD
jgi:CMP/dCMP kinase